MRKTTLLLLTVAIVTLPVRGAFSGPTECREAVDQYKSAKSDVLDATRTYIRCVPTVLGMTTVRANSRRCNLLRTTSSRRFLNTRANANSWKRFQLEVRLYGNTSKLRYPIRAQLDLLNFSAPT